MIFQHTWRQVLNGNKTQTRRLMERYRLNTNSKGQIVSLDTASGHRAMALGQRVSIQPGRTKAGLWLSPIEQRPVDPVEEFNQITGSRVPGMRNDIALWLSHHGYIRPAIEFTRFRQQALAEISDEDLRAEGFLSFGEFAETWGNMHTRPGIRVADNPPVVAVSFVLVAGQAHV